MRPWKDSKWIVFCLAGVILTSLGCQQVEFETAPIRGKLTLAGKPVSGARVLFIPIDGKTKAAGAETDKNGEYIVRFTGSQMGSTIGPHRVKVMYEPANADGSVGKSNKSSPKVSPRFLKGEVEVDVKDTDNVFDFELMEN